MFTGIIQKKGSIAALARSEQSLKVAVSTGFRDLELGESVAVNGVCLTVAEIEDAPSGLAHFYVSPESLDRTNLGRLVVGNSVNLERALKASERLSGHIVQGHVDGLAHFLSARPDASGESYVVELRLDRALSRYCVEKGSIALNGVSLTINAIGDAGDSSLLSFTLIPHTWEHTNLSCLREGDPVNVEVDVLAKYVERLCQRT